VVALVVKNPPTNVRDTRDVGSIPGLGRSPWRGHGNPFALFFRHPLLFCQSLFGVTELDLLSSWSFEMLLLFNDIYHHENLKQPKYLIKYSHSMQHWAALRIIV